MKAPTRTHKFFCGLRLVALAIVASLTTYAFADPGAYTNGVASHLIRAMAYAKLHDWDKMIAQCDEAIRLNPNATDAYRGRGAAYYEKQEWNNVISNYSEVLRLDTNDGDAYSYIGYACNMIGNYDKAIDSYNKYLDFNTNSAAEYFNRGFAYGKKGEVDRAISDYDKAIKLDPKNADAFFGRGYEYGYKKDFDKVISDFSEAIRLKPKNAQAYFYRGYTYRIKGDLDKAADDYIKSSELDPNNPTVWDSLNSLAWQLATSPDTSIRNGKRSLEVAKRACELSKWGDWRFIDTLAAAYAETSDFDNAVKYQKMTTNMEQSAKIQEQFGLVQRLQLYEQKKPYHEAVKH